MIFAVAAVGLAFMMGVGGIVSLGHSASLGIGAYLTVLAQRSGVAELAILLPVSAVAAAVFALITGALALRTTPLRFLMTTLVVTEMLRQIVIGLAALGGSAGLLLPQRSALFGTSVATTDLGLFWTAFAVLATSYVFYAALAATSFGRALRAARQNRALLERFGRRGFPLQLKAMVLASALAGPAGVLLANLLDGAYPAAFEWQQSAELVLMAVLAGSRTFAGAIAGAAGLIGFEEYTSQHTALWRSVVGLVAIAIGLTAAALTRKEGKASG
jgi:branched-chain amino acid transport system permease protein